MQLLRQPNAHVRSCVRRSRQPTLVVRAFKEADVAKKQAQKLGTPLKQGDRIPMDQIVFAWDERNEAPTELKVETLFKGKKAVLFGLPGAYTSVCSSKHVPEFLSKREDLHKAGIETIACASINDAYVMHKWFRDLGVDPKAINMMADGDGSFHKSMGLTQFIPGLGERSLRYSMYLEDGVVKILNIEDAGGMNYKISGPNHMLKLLEDYKKSGGKSV